MFIYNDNLFQQHDGVTELVWGLFLLRLRQISFCLLEKINFKKLVENKLKKTRRK